MEERYNVYFAGQVIEGHDAGTVRDKLAKLFNADDPTLDKLFSGKNRLIKRDCDAPTAQKYKEAMERAGVIAIVQLSATEPAGATTQTTPAMTAAEKIAALAAAPDESRYQKPSPEAAPTTLPSAAAPETGAIGLEPPGTEVLREHERAPQITRDIDTSNLQVDATATRLSEEPQPDPAPPDTRHLSMGEVGDTIPTLPSSEAPLTPNLEGLALSAPGTDFSDCARPEPTAAPLDLSELALDPPGADLLEEKYRRQDAGAPPATDHISLED